MVAHVEEAHALLDEFDVPDESKGFRDSPPLLSVYGRSSSSLVRRPCSTRLRAGFISILLILALGLVAILHTRRTRPLNNGESEHLGYLLHSQRHASRPPTTLVFNWTITSGLRSPDGVEKQVYFVNGQFPGPLIEARTGDRIIIHVRNDLQDEGVSLHWHGLLLKNQNAMDGAVGFTQDAISPETSFAYNFTIGNDEHGTFWWHSHSDLQRADGLWGGLVVHSPNDIKSFKQDYLIMVGDWFHRNQSEVLGWYADPSSRGNEPVPDSLLVNGRGRFNCSMAVPARPINCSQVILDELRPLFKSVRDPMRLRVVNTGSVAGFSIGLEGAALQPLFVDGGFGVQSQAAETVGVIYPGQRVDLIVTWESDYTHSRQLVIYMDEEDFGYPNPSLDPVQVFPAFAQDVEEASRNGTILTSNTTEVKVLDSESLKAATRVTDIPPKAQQAPPNGLDLEYPVRRDTVSVPRRGHVVLVLVADNPGIWALHCHMLVHMARGMAMALDVKYVDDVAPEHV